MDSTFKSKLFELFKKDSRLWDKENKVLNETLLKDLIDKLDPQLLGLLLGNKEAKDKFFIKVNDVFVLKQPDLKFFIDENKLDNSYTQYQNTIGLRVGNKLLSERDEVVLDYPFKDCVLEGGMTKDDQKRNEIFFNEILAKDEIDRLEDRKVLVNWKRYTSKGEEKVKELKRDVDGIIRENIIIKGNNLLALHSLKEQFASKIKLIYIDPPYNIGGDFQYNDSFNHSTWLVFMKNRLRLAKDLLLKDGQIFIQIDYIEQAYLKVLCDEIFGRENFIQIISVKTATPSGVKVVNPGPVNVTEFILNYAKDKSSIKFKTGYVGVSTWQKDYSYYIKNIESPVSQWKIVKVQDVALKEAGYKDKKELENKVGKMAANFILSELCKDFAFKNAEKVFASYGANKPSKALEVLIEKSTNSPGVIIHGSRDDKDDYFILNGRLLAFYKNKLREIDGKLQPSQVLSDFWSDMSWDSVHLEGGVRLSNGKKPESLLKRIIELSTNNGDIVLDYHLGSGTTCAVAHKMNRQYIGIEQLDYADNDSVVRLKNVIKGDESGISKSEKWQGGGHFIYIELAKWNQEAKENILKAKSLSDLVKLFEDLYERYFLNYNVKTKKFKDNVLKEDGFKKLSLGDQKKFFIEMLDMNQMYVNFSERSDKKYKLSKEDVDLSEDFYNTKK